MVDLYFDAVLVAETQVSNMRKNIIRTVALRDKARIEQQLFYLVVTARDPDVNIPRLPRQRIRIKASICLALQNDATNPPLGKNLRIAGRFLVHQAVMAANSFDKRRIA